jgi:hypothetical protein
MRWRVIAIVSLGVNVVLAAIGVSYARRGVAPIPTPSNDAAQASNRPVKTNVVLRRQFFSWQEVESPDYPTYVANLRDIGCPEQTIRDIIIADVNGLYARKRATEMVTPDQQWWRTEPDAELVAAAAEKSRILDEERRGLLGRLLGTNWESGDLVNLPRPSRQGIALDGPVLGTLPTDTKQAIEEISLRTQDRLQAYLDDQRRAGKTPDPAEVARLRQQTRTELERVLTPFQLEEFLLRYSQNANDLRADLGSLRFFNATSNEFRAMFRATDALDQQIQLLAGTTDENLAAQRKALENQRDNALKIALGQRRFEQYQQLHDPVYRDAVATAEQAGTPDAARLIYEINMASAAEQARINADTNLTAQQRSIELKRLELEQLQANTVLTGMELPPGPPPVPAPPKKILVLGPGDSAATLAAIYGVPISALRAANPNLDITRLKPGDAVNIPANALAPGTTMTPPFPIR